MGENSEISWTHHTFNPWTGCTKVSPACQHCYAESWAKRTGIVKWGDSADRRKTSAANWREPVKWNRAAEANGVRKRVFCASLADVFEDREELKPWRKELFDLIYATPMLDWLLLTKRPENIGSMLKECRVSGDEFPPNAWLGTTVENDDYRSRIDALIENGGTLGCVLFLSCEPMLGSVDLRSNQRYQVENGDYRPMIDDIDWVICGGESGHGARPMNPEWARSLRDQCVDAGVPFHFKQWGEWIGGDDIDNAHLMAPQQADPEDYFQAKQFDLRSAAYRVGKKAAGRLLDGREWNEFPQARAIEV